MLSTEEWSILALSARVALFATAIGLVPGIAIAFWLVRTHSPLRFVVENIVQFPLVLPPVVTGLLLLIVLGPEGLIGKWISGTFGIRIAFTSLGAAVAAGLLAFPLIVQTLRVTFAQIDPTWEEAAFVYGGGRWSAFRHVILPLAARGVAAGMVLAFARAIGEFGATIVFAGNLPGRTRTIPLAIFTKINQMGGEAAAIRLVVVAVSLSALKPNCTCSLDTSSASHVTAL